MESLKTFKLLGINDDESTCQVCGRSELKAVYWLENRETGEQIHVGRTCGPRLLRCTSGEFKAFETAERVAADKAAQTWFSGRASVKAYRAELERLNNGPRKTFAERLETLTPLGEAVKADREEAKRLFPLCTKYLNDI